MTISTNAASSPALKRRTSPASCTASCSEMNARVVGSVAGREDSKVPETAEEAIIAKALEWHGGHEPAVSQAESATSSPTRKFLWRWKRAVEREMPQGVP